MMTKAMRILHVTGFEQKGGAAKASKRIHAGLNQVGVESQMFVLYKDSPAHDVLTPPSRVDQIRYRVAGYSERRALQSYPERDTKVSWSVNRFPTPAQKNINTINPDIVHLHWVHPAMVSIKTIAHLAQPFVWTLHDMWAMTGGCHITQGCNAYQDTCGNCPTLGSNSKHDLSYKTFKHKQTQWADKIFHIITPSHWLATCAQSSKLLQDKQIHVIPNGLDLQIYRPYNRDFARELFNLPKDKKLILFGAYMGESDPNKGFHHLEDALGKLGENTDLSNQVELVLFGHQTQQNHELPFAVHHVGYINDERLLALLYSTADVLIVPSLQENLPNTIAEAIACGTPCIAFNIGGIPDMITHRDNGFLATPYDANELAEGIRWVLADDTDWIRLSANARQKAEDYLELGKVAQQHKDLYQSILTTNRH